MPENSSRRSLRWSNAPLLLSGMCLVIFLAGHAIAPGQIPYADSNLAIILIAATFSAVYKWLDDNDIRHNITQNEILTRLDRIVEALEKRLEPASVSPVVLVDLARVGSAIAQGDWEAAQTLLDEHPSHPDTLHLTAKLAAARRNSSADLTAQLDAAKQVADPGRVLEIRDKLAEVIEPEPLRTLDATLAKWFMPLIMKRLRTGSVGADVADLAGKVADRFAGTLEGASLRASLPTLRRSAGLCPRCSRPYRGIADACPICLAPSPMTSAPPDSEAEADEVEKLTRPEESPFLNLDDPL